MTVDFNFDLLLRSGYYNGINLDWNMRIMINGNQEYTDVEGLRQEIESDYNYYHSNELTENEFTKKLIPMIVKEVSKTISFIEQVYGKCCTDKLIKIAQFSNGEAVYQKAS